MTNHPAGLIFCIQFKTANARMRTSVAPFGGNARGRAVRNGRFREKKCVGRVLFLAFRSGMRLNNSG